MRQSVLGFMMCGLIAFVEPALAQSDQDFVYSGRVGLRADRSIITFPLGVYGLVFDTAQYDSKLVQDQPWMFLGDLKVETIVLNDSVVPLTDEAQMEGISIASDELLEALKQVNVRAIFKSFKGSVPGDTLYWDSIRVRWHVLADFSRSYEIKFSEDLPLDSVVDLLEKVPELDVGSVPKVIQDDWFESSAAPLLPNDSSSTGRWLFSETTFPFPAN